MIPQLVVLDIASSDVFEECLLSLQVISGA